VHSTSGGGTVYTEGTDYVVDYQAGLVMLVAGGAIAAAATVYTDYNWGAATRSAAGRIVTWIPADKCGLTSGIRRRRRSKYQFGRKTQRPGISHPLATMMMTFGHSHNSYQLSI